MRGRWRMPSRLVLLSLVPLLAGLSIAVFRPEWRASVSQISGTLPRRCNPGLHLVVPLVQSVETYDLRDQMFETSICRFEDRRLVARTNEGGLELGLA